MEASKREPSASQAPSIPLLAWEAIRGSLRDESALLLGNGFSISCDTSFAYANLLEVAVEYGLPRTTVDIFQGLDTTNFEEVLRFLDRAAEAAVVYDCKCGVSAAMRSDINDTREALIKAIAQVHGSMTSSRALEEGKKETCLRFLSCFKYLYTLNYDFLLYWVLMHGLSKDDRLAIAKDGFFRVEPVDKGNYYEYLFEGGVRFLHGALHLYVQDGEVKKYVWRDEEQTLLEQVSEGLEEGRYPLFIAEGDSEKKRQGIRRNPYLEDCFSEFSYKPRSLVVLGSSLGPSDAHLKKAIAYNNRLEQLYLSFHGDIDSSERYAAAKTLAEILEMRRDHGKMPPLQSVGVFNDSDAPVWR